MFYSMVQFMCIKRRQRYKCIESKDDFFTRCVLFHGVLYVCLSQVTTFAVYVFHAMRMFYYMVEFMYIKRREEDIFNFDTAS